jgi:hypothetical protein
MANYGPADFSITYDGANITQYVMTINDFTVEQALEEVHSMGDSWEEFLPVGVGKVSPIELGGIYDDTAVSGPNAKFAGRVGTEGPSTAAKSLVITWGGTKTSTTNTHLVSYTRKADRNGLTKWSAKLAPTGAVTEA